MIDPSHVDASDASMLAVSLYQNCWGRSAQTPLEPAQLRQELEIWKGSSFVPLPPAKLPAAGVSAATLPPPADTIGKHPQRVVCSRRHAARWQPANFLVCLAARKEWRNRETPSVEFIVVVPYEEANLNDSAGSLCDDDTRKEATASASRVA